MGEREEGKSLWKAGTKGAIVIKGGSGGEAKRGVRRRATRQQLKPKGASDEYK